MTEPIGFLITGLFAIGMGIAFFAADPHSPTSRALALFFVLIGVAQLMNIPAFPSIEAHENTWIRLFAVAEMAILITAFEWGLRVARTQISGDAALEGGERMIRIAQGLACVFGLMGIGFPDLRSEVWNVAPNVRLLLKPTYYLFAIPFYLAAVLAGVPIIKLVRAGMDPAERSRFIAFAAASPFWIALPFLSWAWMPVSCALGEIIFLVGAIRYHVLQGQRGQFVSRFVSPELVQMVRERGLASTMDRSRVEMSVVACDLRGFTAFAETGAPEEVMKLLEDYYAAVGEAVAEFGGSIKDFAGDGILALVGAPIALADHAARAVRLALEIHDRGEGVLARWRRLGLELGLGVGVASGFATVGAIGGTGRLEYGAVGPAVNLASRLAGRAEAGQVLAEPRVVGLTGADAAFHFEKLEAVELKGFARPVPVFAIARGDPQRREAARR